MTTSSRPGSRPSTRRERRAQERAERVRSPRPAPRARAPRSPWRSPFVLVSIAALGLGLVIVAAALLPQLGRSADRTGDDGLAAPAEPIAAGFVDGLALGRADAPVTLEVYSDYQCPVCGRFAIEQLPRLVHDFVARGDLRIVDRPIAILGRGSQDESLAAATGAVCAGRQDQYWAYHDLLMANQDGENRGGFRAEILERIADRTGIDRAAWDACVADGDATEQVRAETATALAAGINSTPTFVLNGERIVGLMAYQDLAAAISTARSSAP